MEETISLKDLFIIFRKRVKLIGGLAVIAVFASGIISYFFLTPIYQSTTQLLVNQSKNKESVYNYNEVQTNLQLIDTYNVIIKSRAILDLVRDRLNLNLSSKELEQKISVTNENNSQVVNITVNDESPKIATNIANTTAEVFQKGIVKIMNVDNVTILTKAESSSYPSPVKPQPLLNMAIALVIGLMAGVGLAIIIEYFDNSIKTERDIEQQLGIPVLGVIKVIDSKNEAKGRKAMKNAGVRGEVQDV
ncbi:YveK family protein [Bacillus testis]|uniref:YveK family protein n=1 Tax=Bacillus testis TaxID=1622072 RepID=UPI00067E69E1|nr:Wzz/FepE/Etk N-terminal domain-containing protein [Bacillus testis]